jgi:hypothetical protein
MDHAEVLMQELVGEASSPPTRHFVLLAQPPAQPSPSVVKQIADRLSPPMTWLTDIDNVRPATDQRGGF